MHAGKTDVSLHRKTKTNTATQSSRLPGSSFYCTELLASRDRGTGISAANRFAWSTALVTKPRDAARTHYLQVDQARPRERDRGEGGQRVGYVDKWPHTQRNNNNNNNNNNREVRVYHSCVGCSNPRSFRRRSNKKQKQKGSMYINVCTIPSCSVRSLSTMFFSQGHVADGDVPQGVRRRRLGLLVAALEAAQDDVLTSPSHQVTSRNTAVKQTTTARQGRNVSANHQAMRAGAVGLRSRGWNGRLARRQIDTERGEEQRQERESENKKRAQGRKEKRLNGTTSATHAIKLKAAPTGKRMPCTHTKQEGVCDPTQTLLPSPQQETKQNHPVPNLFEPPTHRRLNLASIAINQSINQPDTRQINPRRIGPGGF